MVVRLRRTDAGFTLVEAVVASFVVILLVTGFGRAMTAALDGSADNATAQEATALAVEHMEFYRSLEWPQVAMSAVPTGLPMVDTPRRLLVGAEAGLGEDESLVVAADGLVAPVTQEEIDGQSFVVNGLVSDAGGGLRRLIVLVTWESDGEVANFRTSTLISEVSTR